MFHPRAWQQERTPGKWGESGLTSAGTPRTDTFGRTRLLPLDAVRGAAALIVAASHAVAYGAIPLSATAPLCVVFFFLLSGFVLAHAYGEAIASGALGFREYVVIRLARLYPLHIVTMSVVAAFWACVALGKWLASAFGLPIVLNLQTDCGALEIVEGVALIHFLLGGRPCFNSPSWSISVELWCSFFVFLLLAPNVWVRRIAAALALTGFAVAEINGGFLHSTTQWIGGVIEKNYAVGFGCFVIGWALYRYRERLSAPLRVVPPVFAAAAVVSLFAFAAWSPPAVAAWKWVEVPFIAAFCVAILLCAPITPRSARLAAAMERAGDWSYGIYLWHVPAMLVVTAVARALERTTGISVFGTPVIDLAYYPLLLTLAAVFYRRLELPAKHWLRAHFGYARAARPAAPSAAVPRP